MAEEYVGIVVKYFAKPSVAALEITAGSIKSGDVLRYKGHTTDFKEQVTTLEMDNKPLQEARAGDLVGIKVKERVRENDKVFKVVD